MGEIRRTETKEPGGYPELKGVDLMRELLEVVARALVNNPDAVQVNEVQGETSVILELKVAPDDMGKVIGKQGRIAKAIRTVIRAAAARDGRRVMVEIVEHS
ncbi:MAG: uncharacterized protein PWR31_835 [Bacillota bacterium]|nr:uncharacterized protein [Bacillota bacterium]MDK2927145.1 uncharacterized protein [Bacillota bacterium]